MLLDVSGREWTGHQSSTAQLVILASADSLSDPDCLCHSILQVRFLVKTTLPQCEYKNPDGTLQPEALENTPASLSFFCFLPNHLLTRLSRPIWTHMARREPRQRSFPGIRPLKVCIPQGREEMELNGCSSHQRGSTRYQSDFNIPVNASAKVIRA